MLVTLPAEVKQPAPRKVRSYEPLSWVFILHDHQLNMHILMVACVLRMSREVRKQIEIDVKRAWLRVSKKICKLFTKFNPFISFFLLLWVYNNHKSELRFKKRERNFYVNDHNCAQVAPKFFLPCDFKVSSKARKLSSSKNKKTNLWSSPAAYSSHLPPCCSADTGCNN